MIPPPDVLALIGVVALGGGVAVLLFEVWARHAAERRDSAEQEGRQE